MIGYEGHDNGLSARQADEVADVMDAIHNLPHLVNHWEECDESLLRGMLDDCDKRWGGQLLQAYDQVVVDHAGASSSRSKP